MHRSDEGAVTYLAALDTRTPKRVEGTVVLEPGSPIVWFTFPDAWHDIGRFHLADGTFTGIYADIIEPVELRTDGVWHITDLFLDLFVGPDGPRVLDRDELREAEARGWVDAETAARARAEAGRLLHAARAGAWPPPIVEHWTLERVRDALAER